MSSFWSIFTKGHRIYVFSVNHFLICFFFLRKRGISLDRRILSSLSKASFVPPFSPFYSVFFLMCVRTRYFEKWNFHRNDDFAFQFVWIITSGNRFPGPCPWIQDTRHNLLWESIKAHSTHSYVMKQFFPLKYFTSLAWRRIQFDR